MCIAGVSAATLSWFPWCLQCSPLVPLGSVLAIGAVLVTSATGMPVVLFAALFMGTSSVQPCLLVGGAGVSVAALVLGATRFLGPILPQVPLCCKTSRVQLVSLLPLVSCILLLGRVSWVPIVLLASLFHERRWCFRWPSCHGFATLATSVRLPRHSGATLALRATVAWVSWVLLVSQVPL